MRNRNPVCHYPPCSYAAGAAYVADRSEMLDLIGFCEPSDAKRGAGTEGHDLEHDFEDELLLVATG
ncbi:MAG: hypothetical protein HY914_17620 [Desulfomonile tiedjei]|nr:hypothetical protein [Desulfomonile tiedjei]